MKTVYDHNGNEIKIIEKKDLDYMCSYINIEDQLPQGDVNGLMYFNKTVKVNDIIIPQYSRGWIISMSEHDAAAIVIDLSQYLYLCFRNSDNWYCRKL